MRSLDKLEEIDYEKAMKLYEGSNLEMVKPSKRDIQRLRRLKKKADAEGGDAVLKDVEGSSHVRLGPQRGIAVEATPETGESL